MKRKQLKRLALQLRKLALLQKQSPSAVASFTFRIGEEIWNLQKVTSTP